MRSINTDTAIYTITLGNVEARKGHRADCAQCEVEVDVRARGLGDAIEIIQRAGRKGLPLAATKGAGRGIIAVRVRTNPETINVRSVRSS